jgi:3-oxoacyl-[acyl-carrier protein] reductase
MSEAAKVMMASRYGRIVNFATVATPLNLEGEAVYAASKAAVESFTRVASREFAPFNITVNAVGPTPVMTDLIRNVPRHKIDALLASQAIRRLGEHRDIINVLDFLVSRDSDFITGQTIYLGGVV